MANETLPVFRYHPEPLKTGSVVPSEEVCLCCEQARGYIYAASVYAEEELDQQICPWCVASGEAAEKFDCEYTDASGVGGYGRFAPVSGAVVEEVSRRTPGFASWQQEVWWTHCGDAGEFLGPVGKKELDEMGPGAWEGFVATAEIEGENLRAVMESLDRDHGPTAYLFRCMHCGVYGAPWDSH